MGPKGHHENMTGEVVNIDGVARAGVDAIGTDGPIEDVGSGMVT